MTRCCVVSPQTFWRLTTPGSPQTSQWGCFLLTMETTSAWSRRVTTRRTRTTWRPCPQIRPAAAVTQTETKTLCVYACVCVCNVRQHLNIYFLTRFFNTRPNVWIISGKVRLWSAARFHAVKCWKPLTHFVSVATVMLVFSSHSQY